ncbi:hypothetical protein E3N88_26463 [Mikania micrantha]|uniref:Exostosin GT47 domain-containing protein n=1 Tax=Mikania micrantha TaxID=192012 RepID=A0A5N6N7R2_9ASTR|nr:hypothetical protein E3N88_26463 [Mikania micrantha]
MGSTTNMKNRVFGPPSSTPCTRSHQIGALALIALTFFTTRLLDQSFAPSTSLFDGNELESDVIRFSDDGVSLRWPRGGYGSDIFLKIYVYDENEIDGLKELLYGRNEKISTESCLKGQWGTQVAIISLELIMSMIMIMIYHLGDEIWKASQMLKVCLILEMNLQVKIHKLLLKSRFRTHKKEDADLFFVPSYVKCVRMMGGLNDKEINQTYVKVLSQMPYFRLSGGRDHIFVFPSGAGAHLFKSWATYINRSIILTPEANKRDTSAFNTWKDIIIPGNVDDGMTTNGVRLVEPLPLSKRKYLANYLGRAQGKIGRLQLIDLAKQFPDKLESPELKFSGPDKLGRTDYFLHLRNAKFCLAPRGESSWTLRFYESFFVECVPVLLSDHAELPFQNVVDYSQISIKWPSSRIGTQLLEYLESIPGCESFNQTPVEGCESLKSAAVRAVTAVAKPHKSQLPTNVLATVTAPHIQPVHFPAKHSVKVLPIVDPSYASRVPGGDSCPSFDLTLPRSKWSRFERCFRGAIANIFAEADVKHVLEVILSGCCRWIEVALSTAADQFSRTIPERVIDVVYGPKAGTKKNENTEKAKTISSKLNQFSSTDNNLIIKSGKRMNGIPQIRVKSGAICLFTETEGIFRNGLLLETTYGQTSANSGEGGANFGTWAFWGYAQVHQLDVKSAFLNGNLNEDIYVQQLEGHEVKGQEVILQQEDTHDPQAKFDIETCGLEISLAKRGDIRRIEASNGSLSYVWSHCHAGWVF